MSEQNRKKINPLDLIDPKAPAPWNRGLLLIDDEEESFGKGNY